MSAEKKFSSGMSDLPPFVTAEKGDEVSSSGRVDINTLLNRARKERKKETLTNVLFIGLAISIIFVVGIILSF